MIPKKLTPGEITLSVEKIRRKYDEYIDKYFKPSSLRKAFEGRYLKALQAKVDVSSFLLAEISAIQELIAREEERVRLGPVRPAEKEPSFADKVLEENRARISGYRDVVFHADAGEEVRRLAGALTDLAGDRWQDLASALVDTMYTMSSSEMLALDSQLRSLASPGAEEAPQALNRLVGQLRKFPRSYSAIDRDEKEYILEAAFFLHDLSVILKRVVEVHTDISASKRKVLEDSITHVWAIISDFRLKDLKRKRRGDHPGA
jgi:hypothetical protein